MEAIFLWNSTYRGNRDIEVNKIKFELQSQKLRCTCRVAVSRQMTQQHVASHFSKPTLYFSGFWDSRVRLKKMWEL